MKWLSLCLCLVLLGGCGLPWSNDKYESYHPVIHDLTIYPGMRTRDTFYGDVADFWAEHANEKPDVDELLNLTYDLDTVLEAREAQIKAYNEWARDQNRKNGYAPKEF